MSLFNFGANFNRPGPGIPKDAPKKTGAKLFFEILGREFWSLLSLNLIYILACLPIITIGPATAALSRVTITMVRDQNVYVWRDFWEAFRKNIKQGLLFGIPSTMFVVAALLIDFSMVIEVLSGQAGILQMALIVLWTFLGVSAGCYIFPMVAYISLPWLPLLKNSLLLIVLGKLRTFAAVIVNVAVASAFMLWFPVSVLAMLVGVFAFLSFFTSFMVWPVIDKYVIHGAELQASREEAENDATVEEEEAVSLPNR